MCKYHPPPRNPKLTFYVNNALAVQMSFEDKSSSSVPFQRTCCPCIEILDSSSYTPFLTSEIGAGALLQSQACPLPPLQNRDSSEETSFEHFSWSTTSFHPNPRLRVTGADRIGPCPSSGPELAPRPPASLSLLRSVAAL